MGWRRNVASILLCLAAVRVDGAPPADAPGFKDLVTRLGYRTVWRTETHALLYVDSVKPIGVGFIATGLAGATVWVRMTVVNRPDGYLFSDDAARRLEVINLDLAGLSFELDRQAGDIDLIARRPLDGLTREAYRDLVEQVAAMAVGHSPRLNRLAPPVATGSAAPPGAASAAPASHPNLIRFRSILERSGLRLNQFSKDPEKQLVSLPDSKAVPSLAWIEVSLRDRDQGVVGLEVGSPEYRKDESGGLPAELRSRVAVANRAAGAEVFDLKSWGRILATRSLGLSSLTPEGLLREVTAFANQAEVLLAGVASFVKTGGNGSAPDASAGPAVAAAAGAADRPADIAVPTWRQVVKKRDRLEKNQGLMQGVNADAGERWRFTISAASGSGFDAFVVDKLNKLHYEGILLRGSGSMESFVSKKSFERVSFEWSPPSTNKYWLIVDNTSFPDGGSQYNGWFDVDILIEYLPAR